MTAAHVWTLSIAHTFAFGVSRVLTSDYDALRQWALVADVIAFACAFTILSQRTYAVEHAVLTAMAGGLLFATTVAYFADTALMLVGTCAMASVALCCAQAGRWFVDDHVDMHATMHAIQHAIVVGLVDALCAVQHTYLSRVLVVAASVLTIVIASFVSWKRLRVELAHTMEAIESAPSSARAQLDRRAAHLSGDALIDIVVGVTACVVTFAGVGNESALRVCAMAGSRLVLLAGVHHYVREHDCELGDLPTSHQLSNVSSESVSAVRAYLSGHGVHADDEVKLATVRLSNDNDNDDN